MYNISYEVCSLIFLIILLVYYYNRRHMMDVLSSMFGSYMLIVVAEVAFSILTSLLSSYGAFLPLWFHDIIHSLCIAAKYFVPLAFFGYYYLLCKGKWSYGTAKEWLYMVPVLPCLVLLILNPMLHWYYWYDEAGTYHRGWAYYFIYVFTICYFLLSIQLVVNNKKMRQEKRLKSIGLLPGVGILMMGIEILIPSVSLFGFCFVVCTLITYLVFENPIDYISKHTGILNRAAFEKILPACREKKMTAMYVITLDDFKLANNIIGSDDEDKILHAVAQKLVSVYQMRNVFWLGNGSFVILERSEEKNVVTDELKQFIVEAGRAENTRILLSAGICKINLTDWLWMEMDGLRMVDNASAAVRAMGRGACIELDQSLFHAIRRQEAIEQAIIEAIEKERLEVYYQPIYAQEKKVYQSLEALSRLQVEGYGYIPPDEFIQIAERNGSIVQLGLLVLKKVCECIKKYNLRQRGIRFVEVNASMVQCIQEHFAEDVLAVLEEYDIEPSMLCLEVTESVMTQSQERLTNNMNTLKEAGVFFALDDYGSGYSNINYIIDLPFSIIKLDKHLVWAAFTNENSRNILEYTILMFRRIALEIVAEGVENQYQAQILSNAGVQYFQGYLYAKPLPEEALLTFLEEHSTEAEQKPQDAEGEKEEVPAVFTKTEEIPVVEEKGTTVLDTMQNIALCVSDLQQESVSEFVASLCEETKTAGYRLLIFNTLVSLENQDNHTKGEESIYALLNLNMISALVIMPEQIRSQVVIENLVRRAKQNAVPVIMIDHRMEHCYSILDDGESAFEGLVRHIIERHTVRRVRMLLGASWEDCYKERINIFRTVLEENNIFFSDDQLLCSEYEETKVGTMLDELLAREKELPQAFVCVDDFMAMHLCRALEKHGYHVPEDVLVTGFECSEKVYCTPRLTTASRDAEKVAETIVEIVSQLKQGNTVQPVWKIPYKICHSQSCGCEPFSMVDTNERIKSIYQYLQQHRSFEKQMYQMVLELTDNHTLKECVGLLEPYIMELACDYAAICVKEDYITWLGENEDSHSKLSLGHVFTGRMYRIVCKKNGIYHKDFVAFAAEKILPVQDQSESEAWKMLFLPLHFQQSVLGYVAFGFLSEATNYTALFQFCNRLSQVFASLRKHTDDFILIEEDHRQDMPRRAGEENSQIAGLYNMIGFKNRVDMAMQEVMGMYAEAAVICIGLNNLGSINEEFSHSAGDDALSVLTQALVKCSKGEAITARTGGDEFSVLFVSAGTAELKARAFIEQVKQQLKVHNDITEQLFTVEFSYGIATAIIDMDFRIEEVMAEADRIMREIREEKRAKHNYK